MSENTDSLCNIIKKLPHNVFIKSYDSDEFINESCKTCSLIIQKNLASVSGDSIEFNAEDGTQWNKLYLCCPELDLRSDSKKTLCVTCLGNVNIINRFICKCYTSTGQLNKNFPTNQDFRLFEDFSSDVKNEIKAEELDLSEIESFKDIIPSTTNEKYYMQKFIPKSGRDSNFTYNSRQNEEEVSCELLQSNKIKKHMLKSVWNSNLQSQTVKETCTYSNNFKDLSTFDWRQKLLKYTVNKPFNNSDMEIKLKNISSRIGKKLFTCQYDYTSSQKHNQLQDMNFHTQEKPFKCSQCDYSTKRKYSLILHIRLHSGEKPFKCFQCNYSSANKTNLKFHIGTHTGEKPFKCSLCDYSCMLKCNLKRHMLIHTGEKLFKCLQCDYSFKRKQYLLQHIHIHTEKKPFKCSQCDYSSRRKHDLIQHIRFHTEEKPFKCSQCNYDTKRKHDLIRHICFHTGEKPFKCFQCNYSSTSKGALKVHIRIHTKEKPFKCFHCNHSSATKGNLKHHETIHIEEKQARV